MSVVNLDEQEWNQVIAILTTAPWRDANPLLVKISAQLRQQQELNAVVQPLGPQTGNGPSKEVGS